MTNKANPDVNVRDRDGRTPLINAAIDGKHEVIKLLIAYGADVNAVDKLGNTALHYAAQNQHQRTAEILLDAGCLVDPKDKNGNTLFQMRFFHRTAMAR